MHGFGTLTSIEKFKFENLFNLSRIAYSQVSKYLINEQPLLFEFLLPLLILFHVINKKSHTNLLIYKNDMTKNIVL